MTEHEFSERPLVAGTITGYRAFRLDVDGNLGAVAKPVLWTRGENQARCVLTVGGTIVLSPHMTDHPVAKVDCTCGFYAYYDGPNSYAEVTALQGVIEGYGLVTVGSRGFRASKARIVALVEPDETVLRIWARHVPQVVTAWEKARARYADVPWYATTREALEAHPTVHPDGTPGSTDPQPGSIPPAVVALLRGRSSSWAGGWTPPTTAKPPPHVHASAGTHSALNRNALSAPDMSRMVAAAAAFQQSMVQVKATMQGTLDEIRKYLNGARTPPAPDAGKDPVTRMRDRREAAAQARQQAGLSGTGGIQHRRRRL